MSRNISSSDNTIDIRDVIARVEELCEKRDTINPEDDMKQELDTEDRTELQTLESLLEDLAGNGGDEQWNGNWYPVSLIRDSYFTKAMQELVSDTGDLPKNVPDYLMIDWDATASNLQAVYSSVEFEDATYWYR